MNELWRRLLALFRRGRLDRELQEEMQFHLELLAEESSGKTPRGGSATPRPETLAPAPRSSPMEALHYE